MRVIWCVVRRAWCVYRAGRLVLYTHYVPRITISLRLDQKSAETLLVAALGQFHILELELLFVENRCLVVARILPGRHVGIVLIVT